MFFTALFDLMDGINVNLKLVRKNGQIIVDVIPDVVGTIKPARVTGTATELDEGFIAAITRPIEMAKGIKLELDEYKKSLDAGKEVKKEEIADNSDAPEKKSKTKKPAYKKSKPVKKDAKKSAPKKAERPVTAQPDVFETDPA